MPSAFNIAREISDTDTNLTVMFEWEKRQSMGPEDIVDNYTVTISPRPLDPSKEVIILPNSLMALNVTLSFNTNYTATIVAVNCAGESEALAYPDSIIYSKTHTPPISETSMNFLGSLVIIHESCKF